MHISKIGIDLIKSYEQCKLEAYYATEYEESINKATIGWGSCFYANGNKVKLGDKLVQKDADKLFDDTITRFESSLEPMLANLTFTQNQWDALMSFVYNIGLTNFANSTMLKHLHQGNYALAANDLLSWEFQNHKKLEGLVNRRVAERNLFNKPIQE